MNVAVEYMQQMTLSEYYRQAGVTTPTPFADDIILNPERIPTGHQITNLNKILCNGSWGFFDEPGTRKTLPAQAYALYMIGFGYKVLALMPPVLYDQFLDELHTNFIGSEKLISSHIFDNGPYPVRISKKRVQQAKADLLHDKKPDLPDNVIEHVRKMGRADEIGFSDRMIDRIREAKEPAGKTAEAVGCSKHAIQLIRNKVFREDLYKEWREEDTWPDLMVMSYQMFYKNNLELEEAYRVLIADEAHLTLCHPSTTWKKVHRFINNDGGRVGFLPMTGTPQPNLPTDNYGLIKLLRPEAYSSLSEFQSLHCETVQVKRKDGRRFSMVTGYRNLDLIAINLFSRSSRVTKEQVFSMKKPNIIEREVHLTGDHKRLYDRLVKEQVLELGNGDVITAIQAQSLRQKALRIVTDPNQFSNKPIKDNQVKAHLEELLNEVGCATSDKVIIFSHFNSSVELIAEWFKDLNPAVVYGKSNTRKNKDKFLKDDTCRLMIAHPKSGGVGLNLQGVCRYVIFAEPTSVPGDFVQATERVWRSGQKKHVTIYILKVMKTIWPKAVDVMRGKMRMAQAVTKDRSSMLDELLGDY